MSKKTNGTEPPFVFLVTWYDNVASLSREYHLFYYQIDNSVEIYDVKARRTFLKRTPYSITFNELFVGAQVCIYGRQLKVIGYADEATARRMETTKERSLALLRHDKSKAKWNQFVSFIKDVVKRQQTLSRLKMCQFTREQAQFFYGESTNTSRVIELSSNPIVALECIGKNSFAEISNLVSPNFIIGRQNPASNPNIQVATAVRNGMEESSFIFENPLMRGTATTSNCTICIIKPHAVSEGLYPDIIESILTAGFTINVLELFYVDVNEATEFLEVYKGVVPEYHGMVEQLSSGPCIVLEINEPGNLKGSQSNKGDAEEQKEETDSIVNTFRAFVGPSDPVIARNLRPNTLRAKFGTNKIKNAVHCTDLPEDGVLESEFFFNIMQAKGAR